MPRSLDGRWVRQCAVCGRDYHQRKPDQAVCSAECRMKLRFPNRGGFRGQRGLDARNCETCGSEFQPYRSKQRWCSPECYWNSQEGKDNRARVNLKRRLDHADDPSKRRADNFKQNLRRRGLTPGEYEAKLAAQGGVCVICGKSPNPNGQRAAARLHIDHDHETGQNRDLICLNCNRGLGYFKDDPVLMRAAAEYVERHRRLITEGT